MADCPEAQRYSDAILRYDELDGGAATDLFSHLGVCDRCRERFARLLLAENEVRDLLLDSLPPHPNAEVLYDYAGAPSGEPLDEEQREIVRMHLNFCIDCDDIVEKAGRASGAVPREAPPAPRRASFRGTLRRVAPLAAAAALLVVGPSGGNLVHRPPPRAAQVRSVARLVYPNPDALVSPPLLFPALAWSIDAAGESFEVSVHPPRLGAGLEPPLWRGATSGSAILIEEAAARMEAGATYVAIVACEAGHPAHRLETDLQLDPDWREALGQARAAMLEAESPRSAARGLARRYADADRLPERALALAHVARLDGSERARAAALEAYEEAGANGSERIGEVLEDLAEVVFGP